MTEQQLKRIHPLDIPLEVFLADLPTRPRRIIKAEMAHFTHSGDEYIKPPFTVRHLLMFSRKEIRDWPNIGKKSLNEIEEWLRNIGLQLWEQHDERSLKLLRDHPMYYAAAAEDMTSNIWRPSDMAYRPGGLSMDQQPAAEEAPGQEQHDINKIAEALRREGLALLQTAHGYHVVKLGEVTAQAKQQPAKDSSATCGSLATHGEPVAYLVYAGVCDMRPVYPAHSTRASAEAMAREIKSVTEVRPLFLSPQPTPGHIKTMQQALKALEAALSDDQPYIARSKEAIAALRTALAEQPSPDEINQCDGCRSGLKLRGIMHHDSSGKAVMTCQKNRYAGVTNE